MSRPMDQRDLSALIGFLAVWEGEMMTGSIGPEVTARLAGRFQREGLLPEAATERDVRQAISDLNHRLRYAKGEYDDPPEPFPVPEL
jgi:hypothetical protein